MSKITISFPDGTSVTSEGACRPSAFAKKLESPDRTLVAVKVNNEVRALDDPVAVNATVEGVYSDSKEGAAVYRRSLCFILAAAAHNIMSKKRLLVGHSLGYGYYYTIEPDYVPTEADLTALKNEMERIVKEDLPIMPSVVSYADALALFEKLNLQETRKMFDYINPATVRINTLGDFGDMYFGPLVNRTGILKTFDLMAYDDGFLLRFPRRSNPDALPPFEGQTKLFQIYKEYKLWGKRLNVRSAASLNQLIHDSKIMDFIDITETLQLKHFSQIADQIQQRSSVRLVLIAGPTSSGKTTTSKKLALELQAIGYTPKTITIDNYYVERTKTPRDANGDYDYECLEALNIDMLNQNLLDLFNGKTIKVPTYDFQAGVTRYKGATMSLGKNDILVMEGIHGLNDRLTPLVDAGSKFKIYASALTQLNLDDHNRIPTSDNRLIRRIVRDAAYRGKSAADTISMWENVQRGERQYIFPFQNDTDAILNTALDYELPVLKVYAEPLLRCVTPLQKEYAEASRLLEFLGYFSSIAAHSVPAQSIIREFIGGSAFNY